MILLWFFYVNNLQNLIQLNFLSVRHDSFFCKIAESTDSKNKKGMENDNFIKIFSERIFYSQYCNKIEESICFDFFFFYRKSINFLILSLMPRIEKWNLLTDVEVKVENKVSRQAFQKNVTGIHGRLVDGIR